MDRTTISLLQVVELLVDARTAGNLYSPAAISTLRLFGALAQPSGSRRARRHAAGRRARCIKPLRHASAALIL